MQLSLSLCSTAWNDADHLDMTVILTQQSSNTLQGTTHMDIKILL